MATRLVLILALALSYVRVAYSACNAGYADGSGALNSCGVCAAGYYATGTVTANTSGCTACLTGYTTTGGTATGKLLKLIATPAPRDMLAYQ